MITGVEVKIFTGKEIIGRTYVVGQIAEIPLKDGTIVKARVVSISASGGMENRLRIGFEGGRGMSFNLTAANIMAWRTQVDGYYDKQSNHQSGIEWHDMAL